MPFRCPYCGNQFCSIHRLPENHQCPNISQAQAQKQETASATVPSYATYEHKVTFGQPRRVNGRVYFSPTELKHLSIATLIVIGVGLSFGLSTFWSGNSVIVFSALAAIMTVSFFTHEIAHKVTAQKRGLWSEFRLTTMGAIITIFSMILPFKLISPGAVMISGPVTLDDLGKTSIAGPISNIILSTVFLGAVFVPSPYAWIFVIGAFLNAYIAAFNLIPFGILDGYKIFKWNKKIWVLLFAIAVALAVPSYLLYSAQI